MSGSHRAQYQCRSQLYACLCPTSVILLLRRSLDLEGDGTVPGTATNPTLLLPAFRLSPAGGHSGASQEGGRVLGGPHAPQWCLQDLPTRCATEVKLTDRLAFTNDARISMHELKNVNMQEGNDIHFQVPTPRPSNRYR